VEQIRQHPYAPLLDLGSARVLGVVDEVAMQIRGDDPLRLRLHPGGHKGGEVASRVPFQGQVLGDQSHRIDRSHTALREPVAGYLLRGEAVAKQDRVGVRVGCGGHGHLLRYRRSRVDQGSGAG
jgi:hypothetical protein